MALEILTRLSAQPPAPARETGPMPNDPTWRRFFSQDTPAATTQP